MIQPQNLKILIVEDEADLRQILVARLQVFGFQIFEAEGGDAAFEIFKSNPEIDSVVTDLLMPKGSGIELVKKLKSLNPLHPRVFLTSASREVSKKELYALGIEAFLEKPFDMRVLIEMVRKSMLSNKERWRMPPNFIPECKIDLKLPEYQEAQDNQLFGLGRGGFYIKTEEALPPLEQSAHIKISSAPFEINAIANLKWLEKSNQATYAGFEFVHLNGAEANLVYNWIEDNKPFAYIPSPTLLPNKT